MRTFCICLQKLASRFMVRDDPLEGLAGVKLGAGVANEIKSNAAKAAGARVRTGDKSDRATVEQAIDPRTRMVSNGGPFWQQYPQGCKYPSYCNQ
jgi:hypothetical protein